jgi:hypothetical protein
VEDKHIITSIAVPVYAGRQFGGYSLGAKLSRFSRYSKKGLYGESCRESNAYSFSNGVYSTAMTDLNYSRGYLSATESTFAFRHIGDRMAIAWMDGHASNAKLTDINKAEYWSVDQSTWTYNP